MTQIEILKERVKKMYASGMRNFRIDFSDDAYLASKEEIALELNNMLDDIEKNYNRH